MTSSWTLFRELFWPVEAAAAVPPAAAHPGVPVFAVQTERALRLVGAAMIGGAVALALLALAQPPGGGLMLFTVGLFSALAAGVAGGLLGLLFGMPASVSRVTVVSAAPAATGAPATSAKATPEHDWYRDNDALENISKWLTTAIVTLSIANFNGVATRFDALALAVTTAMFGGDRGMVAGGMVLAAYFVLGFLAGYLWTRRYLPTELTEAVRETRRSQAASFKETEGIVGQGNVATARKSNADSQAATVAVAAIAVADSDTSPRAAAPGAPSTTARGTGGAEAAPAQHWPAPITPGLVADDPWKGRFGLLAADTRATLAAAVEPFGGDSGLFRITIRVAARNDAGRAELAGRRFRLYLHPTFPAPIRMETFDPEGSFLLALACYGAFTIGVQFEDGRTLELDLSTLPGAPAAFRLN